MLITDTDFMVLRVLAAAALGGCFVVVVAYAATRAAGAAWFRSKLDYMKRVLNMTTKGD